MADSEQSVFQVASNLTDDSVYTYTKQAHDRYERKEATPEDIATLEAWEKDREKFEAVLERRGARYRNCTFANYIVRNEVQADIVDKLRDYAIHFDQNMKRGRNIIMYGPKGTGKDHLGIALAKSVFMQTRTVTHWINGPDLLDKFRIEAMHGSDSFFGPPHQNAAVLYVSDILPPTGALSESQKQRLFALVDYRYAHMKPTWLTLNVKDGAEAEERLGPQVVDRLRHDALTLHCNWQSYRSSNGG